MSRVLIAVGLLVCACSGTTSTSLAPAPPLERGTHAEHQAPATPDPTGVRGHAPHRVTVQRIGPELRERMRSSHHRGCPVSLGDLRYLRIPYAGFDGRIHIGEMVVHEDYAVDVGDVFERLLQVRWPIRQMRLVDAYGGNDERSMAANNTSGYNCRRVAGNSTWSKHAFGAAIDLNPVQNPYVTASSAEPRAGRRFADIDRSIDARVPAGVIRAGDIVVRAFARIGWEWGGNWSTSKDYQHFSASGG